MPFQSKSQMRAAFSGALGQKMRSRAKTWAAETPDIKKLPIHKRSKRTLRIINMGRPRKNPEVLESEPIEKPKDKRIAVILVARKEIAGFKREFSIEKQGENWEKDAKAWKERFDAVEA